MNNTQCLSPSKWEYNRLFGAPLLRDIKNLRQIADDPGMTAILQTRWQG